jgi:phosphotransferase system  glucose/maltose/N-acetylglucosamine-specific IIC component
VPIDPTSLFVLALAAMVVGPVTYRLASGGGWLAGLDAFATVAIVGLLLLHVMPDAIHELGVWALALLAAGWVIPGLVERSGAVSAKSAHNVAI